MKDLITDSKECSLEESFIIEGDCDITETRCVFLDFYYCSVSSPIAHQKVKSLIAL